MIWGKLDFFTEVLGLSSGEISIKWNYLTAGSQSLPLQEGLSTAFTLSSSRAGIWYSSSKNLFLSPSACTSESPGYCWGYSTFQRHRTMVIWHSRSNLKLQVIHAAIGSLWPEERRALVCATWDWIVQGTCTSASIRRMEMDKIREKLKFKYRIPLICSQRAGWGRYWCTWTQRLRGFQENKIQEKM